MSSEHEKGGFRGYFEWFVHSQVSGSILLLACTVAALVWATSHWAPIYDQLLHTKIGLSWGDAAFKLSLHHWINDGLMVIFFFVVGLEIKREILFGELASVRRAALPVVAAIGGIVRGLIADGLTVREGEKVGDVDPRGSEIDPGAISDKARAVGGAVLEALLSRGMLPGGRV